MSSELADVVDRILARLPPPPAKPTSQPTLSSPSVFCPGLVLKFSADGARRLSEEGDGAYAFLAPFFESVRDPEANAFVLNVLIIPPSDDVANPAVSVHLDDAVSVNSARLYNAYSVTVLYLHVPADMVRLAQWLAQRVHAPEPSTSHQLCESA